MKHSSNTYNIWWVLVFVFFIYALFTTENPTLDGLSYYNSAISKTNMISPHHLLYTPWCSIILSIFPNSFTTLQYTNIIIAICILYFLYQTTKNIALTICVGFTWGFLRFVSDNECYLVPLLLSIIAWRYFYKGILWKSILYGSIATLFHQIAIFTLIPICFDVLFSHKISIYKKTHILSPILCIPIVYYACSIISTNEYSLTSVITFCLHDYIQGPAELPVLSHVIKLSLINLFRTVFQIHGYVLTLFSIHTASLVIILSAVVVLSLVGIYFLGKDFHLGIVKKHITAVCSLMLYTAFACFSNGNAEFMTIIPFLCAIIIAPTIKNNVGIFPIAVSCVIWNTLVGLIPYHYCKLTNYEDIAEYIHDNPNNVSYVLFDSNWTSAYYEYKYNDTPNNVYSTSKYTEQRYLEDIRNNRTVITDVFNRVEPYSRASLVTDSSLFIYSLKPDSVLKTYRTFYSQIQLTATNP